MRKKILCLALLVGLFALGTMTAYAKDSEDIDHTSTGGTVVYTPDGKLTGDLGKGVNDDIKAMQPGDSVTVSVDLKNSKSGSSHWYMESEIADSMEAADAKGGAYNYKLSYFGPDGVEVPLYDSLAVGGDAGEGLKSIDSILVGDGKGKAGGDRYFYLGEIPSGKGGKVVLTVGLDGETLGNAYQERIANLLMRFAVEPQPTGSTQYKTVKRVIVNDQVVYLDEDGVPLAGNDIVMTGDETDLFPYVLAACLSGALLLIVAFFGAKDRKKEEEGGAVA